MVVCNKYGGASGFQLTEDGDGRFWARWDSWNDTSVTSILDQGEVGAVLLLPSTAVDSRGDSVVAHNQVRVAICGDSSDVIDVPLPPFDLVDAPELARLPTISGASLVCQYTLTDCLWGDLDYRQRFVDGQIEAVEYGWLDQADLYVELSYVNYLRLRCGRLGLLEALDRGGGLKGDIAKASALAGLLEGPEFQAAWRRNGKVIAELIDVCEGRIQFAAAKVLDQLTPTA
jgi:hypothetical protein